MESQNTVTNVLSLSHCDGIVAKLDSKASSGWYAVCNPFKFCQTFQENLWFGSFDQQDLTHSLTNRTAVLKSRQASSGLTQEE